MQVPPHIGTPHSHEVVYLTLTMMIAIFPPTSPTTLIGGLAFGRNPVKEERDEKTR